MYMRLPSNSALLLIDIQKGFLDGAFWGSDRNNKDAEELAGKILKEWRKRQWPIIHVRHASKMPNSPLKSKKIGI